MPNSALDSKTDQNMHPVICYSILETDTSQAKQTQASIHILFADKQTNLERSSVFWGVFLNNASVGIVKLMVL